MLADENNQQQEGERKNLFNPLSNLLNIIPLVGRGRRRRIPTATNTIIQRHQRHPLLSHSPASFRRQHPAPPNYRRLLTSRFPSAAPRRRRRRTALLLAGPNDAYRNLLSAAASIIARVRGRSRSSRFSRRLKPRARPGNDNHRLCGILARAVIHHERERRTERETHPEPRDSAPTAGIASRRRRQRGRRRRRRRRLHLSETLTSPTLYSLFRTVLSYQNSQQHSFCVAKSFLIRLSGASKEMKFDEGRKARYVEED